MTRTFKDKINQFFFKKDYSNSQFLVFFRISIGLFALLHLFSVWGDFQLLFGKYGIIPHDIQGLMKPEYLLTLPDIITFFEGFGIQENGVILGTLALFIASAIALMAGLFTRFSAFLLLILQMAIISGSGMYKYGVDSFMTSSLFYLVIFPSGYFFSLDNLIFKNRRKINLTPFRRLFQLHVSIAYFFSGFSKALGDNWWNGHSIWKSIHLPGANESFGFNLAWLAEYSEILVLLGIGIVLIETLYPIFIWIPKTRKAWLFLTISMHVGIALVLNLYFFAVMMIIWNLVTFYFVPNHQNDAVSLSEKEDQMAHNNLHGQLQS